ncbi:outer membrane beta-barrel protein [Hufsiella ginkgonis]|uniref:Outer membrane beta-barrel protein n=1 Tax=Hufsiella ginkgonis TaxID=2695274 RepID=A0A7K1XUA5_9SPHI|nr:outer membrane beta-barrel protein [Hufsiella ginkgonis]MXV14562.1 outer membrane beta-barrel protein [Hufsiella ginkgonis]
MKTRILLLSFVVFCFSAVAQKSGSVSGILLDSVNIKETLTYATVSVYKAADSSLISYKLSDDKGAFRLGNLPTGIPLRLVINAFRYKVYRKVFTLTDDRPNADLGNLLLSLKNNTLAEIELVAERPPIVVRKDTIEFNAGSFKTLPTAVVEDLLKKLPGVTIAADGSIQVNGKTVSKILVDGKEFFGGDQQIATKNLPANIIDRVQVTEDKEAKRRDPDLIAANTPQVINLKLKKAIKQGAFGKLYGGGGPKDYYEGGAIFNVFRDTTQVSALAYGNNVNKPGFTIGDIQRIGGFARAGVNSWMTNSEGGFALDNISFGGLGNGLQKTAGGGFNLNTLTKGGIKLNGKYFFGLNSSLAEQLTNDDQTLGADRLIGYSIANNNNKSYTHNIGGKMEWKIDSLTTFNFNPTITISTFRNRALMDKTSSNSSNIPINKAVTSTRQNGTNLDFNLYADYWKDFKKAGRSFNMSLNASQRNNLNDYYNSSLSTFYATSVNTSIDQLRDNDIRNMRSSLSANYSEPINKKLTFSANVIGIYLSNENALSTFYKNTAGDEYDVAIPTLSETVKQTGFKSSVRARLRWKATKDLAIRPGMVFNTINLENTFTTNPRLSQDYVFFAPTMNIVYKALSVDYTPSFTEPDVQYVQPVANNTDPLFIQNGNPSLKPAVAHQVSMNLYKNDVKHALNYNLYMNGSYRNDAIVMSRTISGTGVQVNNPVNADGFMQFYLGSNVNKDIKRDKRQITLGTGFWTNYSRTVVIVNSNESFAKNLSFSPRGSVRLNFNDKLEINQNYSVSVNKTTYDDDFFHDRNFLTHNTESELILRLPSKFVWETTYRMQINNQSIAGYNNNIRLWNAGLTYLFMKNNRAQLKFSVNDLLNANVRRYAYITDNLVRNVQSNNLGRYALLTLTYNVQNFGGKVGGKERFFGF